MARSARNPRSARRGLAPLVIIGLLGAAVAAIFIGRTLVSRLNGDSPDAAISYRPLASLADFDPVATAAASAAVADPAPLPAPRSTGPSSLALAKAEAQAAHQAFVAASKAGDPAAFEAARLRLAAAEKAYREAIGSP